MDLAWIFGSDALREGAWGMCPVILLGILLIVTSGRYAFDGEPVRLRFAMALSVTLLVFSVGGSLAGVAKTLWFLEDATRAPAAQFPHLLAEGLKASTRPCGTGLALLGFGLVLVTIGVYRVGLRELRAARG